MPGVHYLEFELYGEIRPESSCYDDYCHQCWKAGDPAAADDSDDTESEGTDEDAALAARVVQEA